MDTRWKKLKSNLKKKGDIFPFTRLSLLRGAMLCDTKTLGQGKYAFWTRHAGVTLIYISTKLLDGTDVGEKAGTITAVYEWLHD